MYNVRLFQLLKGRGMGGGGSWGLKFRGQMRMGMVVKIEVGIDGVLCR